MSILSHRHQQRLLNERMRGWIVYLLYTARPSPLELHTLTRLLDARNFPISRRRLAEELDYLRSLRLLRIFPNDAAEELTEVEQAKWVQRYAASDSDDEMGTSLCARITTAGINFQDGLTEHEGLSRVE